MKCYAFPASFSFRHWQPVAGSVFKCASSFSGKCKCSRPSIRPQDGVNSGGFLCFRYMGRLWSSWITVAITIERFITVSFPLKVQVGAVFGQNRRRFKRVFSILLHQGRDKCHSIPFHYIKMKGGTL